MLTLTQMVTRFAIALILGMLMGFERERVGKEAGIRTAMLVSGGAALFTIAGISIPYIAIPGLSPDQWPNIPDRVIANIVVGIGFLGAGVIIQTGEHVRGLTTAALMWAVAAIGTLVGLGLVELAIISSVTMTGLLYLTRLIRIREKVRPKEVDSTGSPLEE